MRKEYLKNIKRIVIKVGTKSLTSEIKIDTKKIQKLTGEIAELKNSGYEIVLVTSGAISSGVGEMGLKIRPTSMPEKQASASIGQIILMTEYHDCFKKYNIKIGQVLLTESDLRDRQRYLNAKNTLVTLIRKYKVIPIVNENDVVGIEEIIFGENDVLSALIANLIDANLLVLLSDIDGFYYKGELLKEVECLTEEILKSAGDKGDKFSTGGMQSKLNAAKICVNAGIPAVIANSMKENILRRIIKGEDEGTFFYPSRKHLSHKKRWIAYSVVSKGSIYIDEGAIDALKNKGKSLLPGGITRVKGKFNKGDPVDVCDNDGNVIGRGMVNYENEIINEIKGKKTRLIKDQLKENFYEEVIHRDNLVIY